MKVDILHTVRELIAANNNLPEESITMDTTFEDLGMDSLDGMALVDDLEQSFNISIPNAEVLKIRNVRQVVESIEKNLIVQ